MSNSNKPKIMVIGLDGVSFDNLAPLFVEGRLPHLSGLMKRGISAPLRSVYPPMTPAAWPSFSTGKNPGKHGIFGWWEIGEENNKPVVLPVSANSIRGNTLWKILSNNGHRVGLLNVPITYPAFQLDGFMISGFDSPFETIPSSSGMSYPPNLISELHKNGIDYKVMELIESDLPLNQSQLLSILDKWIAIETERTKAAKMLIHKHSPDFMMVVYHIADYFMHRAPQKSACVQRALGSLDDYVGSLLEECDENTTVFVISDHGSIELKKYIFFQNWLVDQGLLKFNSIASNDNIELILKSEIKNTLGNLSNKSIGKLSGKLQAVWEKLPANTKALLTGELQKKFPACCSSDSNIDWNNTKVFSISSYGELFINVKGRHPNGIVDPGKEYQELSAFLINELRKMKDPETGELILKHVVRKEDYYHGGQVDSAPDILCFLRDPTYYFMRYSHYMRPATYLRSLKMSNNVMIEPVTPEDDFVGDHTPNGIFIAAGNSVKLKGELLPANLIDMAPTILALSDIPVPGDMDGKVLEKWFNLPKGNPQFDSSKNDSENHSISPYSNETAEVLRKRLHSLGYNV